MTTAQWLSTVREDAERRGLPDLLPVLDSLAAAIAVLRAEDPGCDGPSEAPPPADKDSPSSRA